MHCVKAFCVFAPNGSTCELCRGWNRDTQMNKTLKYTLLNQLYYIEVYFNINRFKTPQYLQFLTVLFMIYLSWNWLKSCFTVAGDLHVVFINNAFLEPVTVACFSFVVISPKDNTRHLMSDQRGVVVLRVRRTMTSAFRNFSCRERFKCVSQWSEVRREFKQQNWARTRAGSGRV